MHGGMATHNFPQFVQSYQPSMGTAPTQFDPQELMMPDHYNIQPEVSAQKTMNILHELQFTNNNTPHEAATAGDVVHMDTGTANLSSLLDMDSQQFTHINSGDLAGLSLSLLDGTYAATQPTGGTATAVTNVTTATTATNQNQNQTGEDEDNMTDSFTRFATAAMKEINDLNQLYARQE